MTIIAAYLYRNGQRVREISIDEKVDCAHDKSEFVWIGLADPSRKNCARSSGLMICIPWRLRTR